MPYGTAADGSEPPRSGLDGGQESALPPAAIRRPRTWRGVTERGEVLKAITHALDGPTTAHLCHVDQRDNPDHNPSHDDTIARLREGALQPGHRRGGRHPRARDRYQERQPSGGVPGRRGLQVAHGDPRGALLYPSRRRDTPYARPG